MNIIILWVHIGGAWSARDSRFVISKNHVMHKIIGSMRVRKIMLVIMEIFCQDLKKYANCQKIPNRDMKQNFKGNSLAIN